MKQLDFAKLIQPRTTFGGSLIGSGTHPKIARPLDSNRPIHLVLRAEESRMRLPRTFRRVNCLVEGTARKHGVRLYEYANVGNHLHLLIKLPRRGAWSAFIRELTGRIASLTRVRWQGRPFTRVVAGWRRAFNAVKAYVQLNRREVDHGLTRREARTMSELDRLAILI